MKLFASIKNITSVRNRTLVTEMVRSDFKLRYQGSVLGYLWSLLRPLFLFGILYLVFTRIIPIGKGIEHYGPYLLLGLVLWNFFVEATMSGMNAIVGRGDLIRKVSISKYIIVISTNASALVNLLINMVVVFIFMGLDGVDFRPTILLAPLLIIELVILCLGISFWLSALFVKFRDFGHIWEVLLQMLFYSTPIIYLFKDVPEKMAKLMSLSPITQIFQDLRLLMISPETLTTKDILGSQLGRIIPLVIIVLVVISGVLHFRRVSRSFAEEL